MPHHSHKPQKHRHDEYRWIVDFELRIVNDDQRRVVDTLGISKVHDVVKIWMEVITPSHVVEPEGTPIRRIGFERRSDMRQFIKVWGGRIVTATFDLKPSLGTA